MCREIQPSEILIYISILKVQKKKKVLKDWALKYWASFFLRLPLLDTSALLAAASNVLLYGVTMATSAFAAAEARGGGVTRTSGVSYQVTK